MVEFNNIKGYFYSFSDIQNISYDEPNASKLIGTTAQEYNIIYSDKKTVCYSSYPLYLANQQIVWPLKDHITDAVSVACLHNVILREWDFSVYSADRGQLLLHSIGSHRSIGDEDGTSVYNDFVKDNYKKVSSDKLPVIVCSDGHRNYWHWHAQVMLAIIFMQENGLADDKVFVVPKLNSWQRQCLEALGVSSNMLLEVPGGYYYFDKALYPSYVDPRSFIRLHPFFLKVFETVRANLGIALDIPHTHNGEYDKIYVSRQDAPHRTMQNESELISILVKFGFKIIVPSKMTYSEQVIAFSRAKVIVGIHGAGLTNIGFASNKALLIEIFDVAYMNYVYYVLSRMAGCQYESILTSSRVFTPDGQSYWAPDIATIVQSILSFSEIHCGS
jgi:hypothetical protein